MSHLRIWSAGAAMGLIAVSALLKFSDLTIFLAAIRTWRAIPDWAVSWVVVAAPSAELALASMWFCRIGGGAARRLAVLMLLGWTGAYLLETMVWGPPECGCFGKLHNWYLLKHDASRIVGRNMLLMGMLVFGVDGQRYQAPTMPIARQDIAPQSRVGGFTLLEMMCVIALIGILAALGMPTLAAVKERAKATQALNDLQTHAQSVAAYSVDFKDSFPCILNPAYTHGVIIIPGDRHRALIPYFAQRFYWWMGLADGYYSGDYTSPSFFVPRRHGSGRGEPYYYTVSGLARPEYWNPLTRAPKGQIGPMHLSDVLYPSQKGLFVTWEGTTTNGRVSRDYEGCEAALCDGSSRSVRSDALYPSVVDGEGPWGWPYAFDHLGDPITHTVNGVRGRDVR